MATTTLSPYLSFQQLLLPDPKINREGYDLVQNDPELKEASQSYRKALLDGNYDNLRATVYNLATQFANNERFAGYNIKPEDVRSDFEKHVGSTLEQPTREAPEPTPQPPRPGVLAGFFDALQNPGSSDPAGRVRDTVTDKLHSIQEQQLLEEFQEAVAKNDQGKIRELLETRLEAPDLLEDQWRKANHFVEQIQDNNIDKQQTLRLLEEQKNKQLEKIRAVKRPEQDRVKEQGLRENLSHALKTPDTKAKNDAYQSLVHYKLTQTRPYSIFTVYENQQQGFALLNAITALLQAEQQARMRAFRTQQVYVNREEAASQPQAQQRVPTRTPLRTGTSTTKRGLKALGKGFVKAADLGAKALGPEASIVWMIIKKYWWVFVLAFFVFIAIIVTFVVVIISLAHQLTNPSTTNQQTIGTGIHPVAPSIVPSDLVGDIRNRFGITMVNYDRTHLIWAWQKFYDISDTNFINLVRGKIVVTSIPAGSHVFCTFGHCFAFVAQYASQDTFDAILLHEIGHIIQWTQPSSVNHQTELPGIIAREGYLTYYSRINCLRVNQFFEDFAETLTYYLNPTVGQTTGCGHGPNPYANGANPLHYNFAQEVLGKY